MRKPIHKMTTRLFATFLIAAVLLAGGAMPAGSVAAAEMGTGSGLPARTQLEIAEKWKAWMEPQADAKQPYATVPSVKSPYAAGALKAGYIQDAVNAANFFRYITGLPADLTTTAELNALAQHGAVLLAASGVFSHTPPRPSDMGEQWYEKGKSSTSTANIYASYGYSGNIVRTSIIGYMDDSDSGNIDRAGHRRWILNPALLYVGAGQAEGSEEWSYSTFQVFDASRKQKVDYQYVAYPAAGAFPLDIFDSNQVWSVSINPAKYGKLEASQITVKLTRISDNKSWQLKTGNNNKQDYGAYFNAENGYFGSGPALMFRPGNVQQFKHGDRIKVEIAGLSPLAGSGASSSISYTVDFFDIARAGEDEAPFADIRTHWAKGDIEWAIEQGIVNGYPDGTFRPQAQVKEAEFLKMFLSAFGLTGDALAQLKQQVDSDRQGQGLALRWYDVYYARAAALGLPVKGALADPPKERSIIRVTVAEIIAANDGQPLLGNAAIQYLLDEGYSQGKTSATVAGYAGADTLTRAEAVRFIRNLMD